MKQSSAQYKTMLKEAGFRATAGKLSLLALLEREPKPLTVQEIQKKLGKGTDMVTLYRSLEAFAEKGIVARSELGHGHAHYELAAGRAHHHHLVCTVCGIIEDIEGCSVKELQENIAKKSQKFRSIYSHNIEFFGACRGCSNY